MKNNLKITSLSSLLLLIGMPVHADIYFENLTNQNINVKFKVCIEKNLDAKTAPAKPASSKEESTKESKVDNKDESDKPLTEIKDCKKDQDFEASIATGYRAKTKFDNITVKTVNLSVGDKYSNDNSLDTKTPCVAEYTEKDQVIRFWIKDIKTAKQVVVCKAFEDKPLETANSEKK